MDRFPLRPEDAAHVLSIGRSKLYELIADGRLERHVAPTPDAPLFPGPKGGVRRASFYKAWHKALAETGMRPDLKPHDLCHLANTMAAKVPGTTLKDLMARLGQTSPQAALRYLRRTTSGSRDGARHRRRASTGHGMRRARAG